MSVAKITLGAVDNTRAAFDSVKGNLQGLHTQATAVMGALGSVISVAGLVAWAQATVDGVDALNDLKDATGSTIENLSALEDIARRSGASFETVSTSMLKFNGILNDAKPGSDAELALKALNLNVKELKQMDPADALLKTATAMAQFADDGDKARLMQVLFGKSTKDVAAFLKDLAEKGKLVATVTTEQAEEAEKFNKQLADIGKNATDASRALVGPMVTAINQVITKFKEGRAAGKGFFESLTKNYWDNVRDLYSMAQPNTGGASGTWEAPEPPKPPIGTIRTAAEIAEAAAASKKALADQNKELSEQAKLLAELAGLSGSFSEDWARLSTIYKAGKLSLDGLTKAQADLLAKQPAMKAAHDAEAKAAELAKKAFEEADKARLDYNKSVSEGLEKLYADTTALEGRNARLGLSALAVADLDAAELELQATKLDSLAIDRLVQYQDSVNYEMLKLQAEEKRKLANLTRTGASQSVAVEEAKAAAGEWKKTTDDIERGLTDSLFRAFEAGKGFFSTLWSGIKNLFKTTALKLIISPVSGALTGALGMSGAANAATGGGDLAGMASNAKSMMSMNTGWFTDFGATAVGSMSSTGAQLFSKGFETAGNAMMDTANSLAQYSDVISGAGDVLGYAGALYSLSQGKYGAAAGAAIGTYFGGPIGAAIGSKIGGLLDGKADSRFGGGYEINAGQTQASYTGGPVRGFAGDANAAAAVAATSAAINALLKDIGSKASLATYYGASETSNKGRGGVMAGGTLSTGAAFGEDRLGSNYNGDYFERTSTQSPDGATAAANLATDLKQSIIQALQASTDIPAVIKGMVAGIDIELSDSAAVDKLLGEINAVVVGITGFQAAVKALPFAYLRDMSFDTAASFIAAAGGLEALKSKLSSYYENFYSAEEKRGTALGSITGALNAVGLGISAEDLGKLTRPEFRKWYESIATQFGAENPMAMALFNVSDAFAAITPAAEAGAQALAVISDALKTLTAGTAGLQVELLRAQGNTTGADAAQYSIDTAGLTGAERAVFDYNASLRSQITALTDATAAAESAAQVQIAIAGERAGLEQQLLQLQGDTAALRGIERAGLAESNRALFDRINALGDERTAMQTAAAAADAVAQSIKTMHGQTDALHIALLRAQGNATGADAAQYVIDTAGMGDAERGNFDYNAALRLQITAINDAATAAAQAAQAAAQGQAAIASERLGLQQQYDQLTMTSVELLAKQRSGLDASNQALFDQINAHKALQESAAKTAQAMQMLSGQIDQIASFNSGIGDAQQSIRSQAAGFDDVGYQQGQIRQYSDQLGAAADTAGRIKAGGKLQAAIVDRYSAELALINKNKDAARVAGQQAFDAQTAATNAGVSAQNTLNAAYRSIGDYAKSLMSGALSPFSGADQLAASGASYAQLLAGSQSGNLDSLGKLTGAADSYLSQSKMQAVSGADYARVFGRTLNDISALGGLAKVDIESVQRSFMADSTAFDKQALELQGQAINDLQALSALTDEWTADLKGALDEQAMAYVNIGLSSNEVAVNTAAIGPGLERVVTAINSAQEARQAQAALLAEIRALNARVDALISSANKTADNTKQTAAVLDSATSGGGPMLVIAA